MFQDEPSSKMTIVSSGLLRVTTDEWCIPEEQFQRLRDNALNMLLDATAGGVPSAEERMNRSLLLFDCLLRVIDEPSVSSPIVFATERFRTLQEIFYGAMGSDRFIDASEVTRVTWAHAFYKVLKRLNAKTPTGIRRCGSGA